MHCNKICDSRDQNRGHGLEVIQLASYVYYQLSQVILIEI